MSDKEAQKPDPESEDRMTDPGIYSVGDKVIWDGEAFTYGGKRMQTIPIKPPTDYEAEWERVHGKGKKWTAPQV